MLANVHRRSAGQEEQRDLRLLPGALRRHHLYHSHSAPHALLLLQPHRALRAHLLHGVARVHPAPRLRGEAHSRWVIMSSTILLQGYIVVRSGSVIERPGLWRSAFLVSAESPKRALIRAKKNISPLRSSSRSKKVFNRSFNLTCKFLIFFLLLDHRQR